MSSVERSMDTTLPGMVMEDLTVDKQVPVNTTLSEGNNVAIEQHAKEKNCKGKGGFIKRAWKAVKRPFRRSSHETNVEAMVPDTAIPCTSSDGEEIRAQLSSVSGPCKLPTAALPPKEDRCDDLDVVSMTSSDWSVVCNNIHQNSEPPADASSEEVDTEPQEQHVKEERRNGKEEKKKEKEEKKKEKEEKMKKKEKEKEEKKEEKKKEEEEKKKAKEEKKKKKEKEKEEKKKEKEEKKKEEEEKRKKKENEKEEKKKKKHKEEEEKRKEKEEKKKKRDKDKEEIKKEKEEKKKKKEKEKEEKKKEKEEEKKGNGPFIKRAWKAVKRPFRRSSHETNVEAMVPDTAIPCTSSDGEEIRAQLSSVSGPCKLPTAALPPKEDRCDDLDVVSITSSEWSVICNNIQQNSEPPADASSEEVETEPQEQHVKEEKKDHIDFSLRVAIFLDNQRWKLIKLRMHRDHCRRRWEYYMFTRPCPHHRCCRHAHLCCLRDDTIFLGAREQLMSTVPSVTRPFMIFPNQYRNEPLREHNPEEDGIKKEGIFKRKWKAVKRRLFRWESRRTLLKKEIQKHRLDIQEPFYMERIIYERRSLHLPPMFQPSKESFDSSYSLEYVILGIERFGQVCLATRLSDGQKVAFKECKRYYYGTSTYIMAGYTERLMNEVAMMTLLKQPPISPYIIQMLEWFHEEYDTFIIYEDPGSWTVLEKIIELHPLGEKVARVIMRQAVQAAQHCIAHGVFHYFITGQNILINTNTLDIKLIDFGYSMPYMGKKYYRLGDTLECDEKQPEYSVPGNEYSAISVNAFQLGSLLRRMVYGDDDVLQICYQNSNDCRSLIDWCTRSEMTEQPTLEQILQHRWFTKE